MKSQVEEYRQYVRSQITKDLSETITSLQKYCQELKDISLQLDSAKSQVDLSADEASKKISDTFDNFMEILTKELNERKNGLLFEVQKEKEEALEPLVKCETLIQNCMKEARSRLDQGECFQKGTIAVSKEAISNFQDSSASINILPEVPPLCAVPYISVHFPEAQSLSQIIGNLIKDYGSLSRIGPVQIIKIDEKPGALLVYWEEVEDNDDIDTEFKLECSHPLDKDGIVAPDSFNEVYRGKDSSFLVRNVIPNEKYHFRIASRQENCCTWSSWSLPITGSTSISNFCWSNATNDNHWSLADGERLATKYSDEPSIVYSRGAQLFPGSSLLIEVITSSTSRTDEGFGLCWQPLATTQPLGEGSLFLNTEGKISQDGVTRLTQLPRVRNGSAIVLSNERISQSKIRISIEHRDKQVTYDWCIPVGSNGNLFFFAAFSLSGWKIRLR